MCCVLRVWEAYDRDQAAHINLANGGTDVVELSDASWDGWCYAMLVLWRSNVKSLDLRVSQLRSATPRTLTSQHCWVPLEQMRAWRWSRAVGNAKAVAASAMMVMNEVLMFAVWGLLVGLR